MTKRERAGANTAERPPCLYTSASAAQTAVGPAGKALPQPRVSLLLVAARGCVGDSRPARGRSPERRLTEGEGLFGKRGLAKDFQRRSHDPSYAGAARGDHCISALFSEVRNPSPPHPHEAVIITSSLSVWGASRNALKPTLASILSSLSSRRAV